MVKRVSLAVLSAVLLFCLGMNSSWALQQVRKVSPLSRPVHVNPPTPTPASPPQDEVVQETSERHGETIKGLWRVELFQKGIGRNIQMTATCPADTLAISGGAENTGMPVFHTVESFPMGGSQWRVVFARDMSPLNPGQTGVVDLHPPSPYQITLYVYCVNRTIWTKAMMTAQTP